MNLTLNQVVSVAFLLILLACLLSMLPGPRAAHRRRSRLGDRFEQLLQHIRGGGR